MPVVRKFLFIIVKTTISVNKLNCCNSHLWTIEGSRCLDEVMICNEVEKWAWFHNEQQRHFQAGCQQNWPQHPHRKYKVLLYRFCVYVHKVIKGPAFDVTYPDEPWHFLASLSRDTFRLWCLSLLTSLAKFCFWLLQHFVSNPRVHEFLWRRWDEICDF